MGDRLETCDSQTFFSSAIYRQQTAASRQTGQISLQIAYMGADDIFVVLGIILPKNTFHCMINMPSPLETRNSQDEVTWHELQR